MSRYSATNVPITGTNDRDGTRARVRGIGTCPVPSPVPFRPLSVPLAVRVALHEFRGEQRTLGEIATMVGIKRITLYQRMKRKGMTAAEAAAFPARKWGAK